jgi:hypothetical protein
MGHEIEAANRIIIKNSLTNNAMIPATDDPSTFRMPISFLRFSILKETSPNTQYYYDK